MKLLAGVLNTLAGAVLTSGTFYKLASQDFSSSGATFLLPLGLTYVAVGAGMAWKSRLSGDAALMGGIVNVVMVLMLLYGLPRMDSRYLVIGGLLILYFAAAGTASIITYRTLKKASA